MIFFVLHPTFLSNDSCRVYRLVLAFMKVWALTRVRVYIIRCPLFAMASMSVDKDGTTRDELIFCQEKDVFKKNMSRNIIEYKKMPIFVGVIPYAGSPEGQRRV